MKILKLKNTKYEKKKYSLDGIKSRLGGWSQDGILGGRGIRISSQLGHIPGTGGGLTDT